MQGRKRLAFTVKQKMKIIQEIERGKSKSDVARELGLASSTVATIWKNRLSIAESWRNRDMMQTDNDDYQLMQKKLLNCQTTSGLLQPQMQMITSSLIPTTTSSTSIISLSSNTPASTCSSLSTSPSIVSQSTHDNNNQPAQIQTQCQELLEVRIFLNKTKSFEAKK